MRATELINLDVIRQHVRADSDEVSDELLEIYADAALDHCLKVCDDSRWTAPEHVPNGVKAAMLLFIGDIESIRAVSVTGTMVFENKTAMSMLMRCRNWYGGALPERGE